LNVKGIVSQNATRVPGYCNTEVVELYI